MNRIFLKENYKKLGSHWKKIMMKILKELRWWKKQQLLIGQLFQLTRLLMLSGTSSWRFSKSLPDEQNARKFGQTGRPYNIGSWYFITTKILLQTL